MSAESAFASLATGLLHEPGVEEGKPFRGPALTYERKIFAMLVQERLVVKLPAGRCAELVSAGSALPFESGGRRMKEWVSVRAEDAAGWPDRTREALDFLRR